MNDREKVVVGLERCIEKLDTVSNKTHGFNCTACTYFKRCDSSGYMIGLPLMKDAIALLKAQPTVGGWISVKDRLPDEKENWITKDYQKVICCCDFGGDPQRIDVRTYGFGNGHFWHGPQIMDGVITHWMPLPEPPKEDNDAE